RSARPIRRRNSITSAHSDESGPSPSPKLPVSHTVSNVLPSYTGFRRQDVYCTAQWRDTMAAHPTNTISLDRIVQRAKEIATFNTRTYSEVAHDPAALPEAAIVVATVAVAAGLGGVIDGANGLLGGIILSLLGWVVTAAIVYFVGTRITGTPTTTGSVESILRTLGYASGPGIFMILGFLWGIGWIFVGLVNLW